MLSSQQNSYNHNAGTDITPVRNGLHPMMSGPEVGMQSTQVKKAGLETGLTNGLGDSNSHNGRSGSSGLHQYPMTNRLQFMQKTVIPALWKHPRAWPFHQPVDAVKLRLPDYHRIIKQPMDLGTVKRKLEALQYSCAQQCIDDIQLMLHNCFIYNSKGDDVYCMGEAVEKVLLSKLQKMPAEEETSLLELPSSKKKKVPTATLR